MYIWEKATAPHSSTLAWKIPWTEEPGRLQSMGSLRVGQDLSAFTFTFHFHALEEEMATHSSVLAWRIPGTAGPDGMAGPDEVAHSRTRLKRLSSSSSSVYMSVVLSIHLSSFPLFIHKFILYICISIPALQIGSLIPFFLDSIYMHNIQYLFFLLTPFTLYNRF